MSDDAVCGLCRTSGPTQSRNFGLDLCEPCAAGYLDGRLTSWGADIVVEEIERGGGGTGPTAARRLAFAVDLGAFSSAMEEMEGEFVLHVEGRLGAAQPLIATFRARTFARRLRGLFTRRFVSGDALFDHRVLVDSSTQPLVRQLVEHDGFSSAVMSLVTHGGVVHAEPGRIAVVAPLQGLDVRAEIPVAVAAMLRYLADAS